MKLPDVARREVPGLVADLYLPQRQPAPGVVLVLGALREGRRYPLLERVARAIAACGFAVLVPELGRLQRLVLDVEALDDLIAAALALPEQPGVAKSGVGLIGFSLGGSLALVAAADDRLRSHVACVASMGGYFRMANMLAAATTGKLSNGEPVVLAAPSVYAVAASLAAGVPRPDRDVLERALDEDPDHPLEAISRIDAAGMGLPARRVMAILRNRDPGAVASLTREIDGATYLMDRLSPAGALEGIAAPVWLLHDERDRYVPARELRLMREATAGRTNFRSFTIRLLEHTEPRPPAAGPVGLVRDYIPGLVDLARFVRGPLTEVRSQLVDPVLAR